MNADQPAAPQVPYQLVPTNVPGAWVSAWPPDGFDPNVEGAAARARVGMPWRRPDASDSRGLRTAWERAFSHPWPTAGLIVPRLEPQPGVTHNVRGLKKASDGSFTSNNWAGGVVAGTWTGAIGYWHIPTVIAPAEPQGSEGGWNSSSWVGLDGTYGSNDVLQAGVQQRVDSGGSASYVAWYEWFAPQQPTSPGYIFQTNIPNFSVNPGDTVYCSVQYGSGSAQVSFGNEANGEHFSITLAPPPGATFNGNCAEWIMEAPDGGETTASLPSFTPVAFTSAVCCGPNKSGSNPLNGDTWNIVAFGTTLTSVALATDAVTISYAGPTFWVDNDLTNFSNGVPAVGGSALDGYWGSDSSQHVNYFSADGHVHELYIHPGASWVDNDLTIFSNGVPAVGGSALDGYWGSDSSQHVNYFSADGHVHELYIHPGASWVDNDLTNFSNGVPAVGDSALDGYWGTDDSQHVNYFSADGHVHELYIHPGASWVDNDLTIFSNGVPAVGGSALDGYWGSDSSQHVNYFSADGHVHELYIHPGASWVDNDLTNFSNGVPAVGGSALDGYWGSDSSQHVNFLAGDGHVHELYIRPGASWVDNDLTAFAGSSAGIPAVSGSAMDGYWGSDNSQHVNYFSADGHVHELYIHP